tara:strand:+ start:78 stop:590 length:513 start_codon:yes stop_codon:yes gene_type:complete
MPTGLKQSSSTVSIGFSVTETAANTFTQVSVDLNLSPLDREVFVVQGIDMDLTPPDMIGSTNTNVAAALTTTSQTAMVRLSNANCLSSALDSIRADPGGAGFVAFSRNSSDVIPADLDYIGIIATNDFFVSVEGANNTGAKGCSGKLYGYRAIANADIYAALVQSEVLSA